MNNLLLNPYLTFNGNAREAAIFYQTVLGGERLGEGGTVEMPLEKQVWGDKFGSLTDKFGIHWLVDIISPENAKK